VADALVEELTCRGLRAQLGHADSPGTFSGVIHLSDLRASDDVAPIRNLSALAQRFIDAEFFFTISSHAGALGFTRALAQERPDCRVRAIELSGLPADRAAHALADEIFATDTTVEVRLGEGGRSTVELRRSENAPQSKLGATSSVLVTGGARG